MLTAELAEEVRRALVAWMTLRSQDGQRVAPGYRDVLALVTRLAASRLPDPEPELLTLGQAADHAGRDARTIRRWREHGLPTTTRAGRILIRRADLDAWPAPARTSSGQNPDTPGHRAA